MVDFVTVIAFGLFGGVVRVLLGYAKYYEEGFKPQRAWFTLLVAALSGALAAVLIAEDPKVAVIAGLGGSDLVEALWRGLARRAAGGVYATSAGVQPIWITQRQMEALQKGRSKGKLTVAEYMETTGKSRRTASRDLESLVNSGYLTRRGSGRGTYYVPVKRAK